MKRHVRPGAALSGTLICLVCASGCGDGEASVATIVAGTITTSAPPTTTAYDPLTGRGEVELIAEGYGFTEGPQWMVGAGVLLFTDRYRIYQLEGDEEITTFRYPSDNANGLAVDPEGRLIAAEADTRRLTRTEHDGTITPIAELFEGARLNQPNDLAVRSDGTIYFTDPLFADYPAELDFRGVFRVAPTGQLTAERRGDVTEAPNGLVLSPDESRLYVANYNADLVWRFDVATDGSLSDVMTFVTTGDGPDGMAVDFAGNLFVSTRAGIEVYAPDGTMWGVIGVPRVPANCAFGGADGRTLYITAREGIYRVLLAHPGVY